MNLLDTQGASKTFLNGVSFYSGTREYLIVESKKHQMFFVLVLIGSDWDLVGTFSQQDLIKEFQDSPMILKSIKNHFKDFNPKEHEVII